MFISERIPKMLTNHLLKPQKSFWRQKITILYSQRMEIALGYLRRLKSN